MKFRILLVLGLLPSTLTICQILPTNPATGLVSIIDSIKVSDKVNTYEMQQIVRQWQKLVNDDAQLQKVFHYNTGEEAAYFHCSPGYRRGKDIFTDKGNLIYSGGKKVLGQHVTDISNGKVDFSLNYEIRGKYVVFEFTDLVFTWRHDEQVRGRFEDAKTSRPFAVGITANNKKNWERIKMEYIDRFAVLMKNLKEYYGNYNTIILPTMPNLPSGVNYRNYELIKKDMTYEQVKAIIGEDGKEQSNLTQTLLNKEITTRVVSWSDKNEPGKAIIATFRNAKLVIKQQQNL